MSATAVTAGARVRPGLRPAAVLAVGSASSFLVYLDATIVNVTFPDIRASFDGATLAGLSWILSAYGIVFAALLVPGGRFSDLVGGRRLFLAGLAAFTTGSLLCALAPSVSLLVAARIVQAAGGAMLVGRRSRPRLRHGRRGLRARPRARAAGIGSGMSATTRQIGAVLGVAILIAILGPAPGPSAYDAGWWTMAALALAAVVPVALIGRRPALSGSPAMR